MAIRDSYLRIGSGDVFVETLVVVDGVFQVLQLRRKISLSTSLTP